MSFVVSSFLLLVLTAFPSEDCLEWMLKAEVLPGTEECELNCALISIDFSTFICPNQCKKLCRVYFPDYITSSLTWAGNLTETDKALIKKLPIDAISVFRTQKLAEEATERLFKGNFRNDESDAFRHFVWSGLLMSKLGREKALLFLESHESAPSLPKNEVDMDKHNNAQGISAAENFIKAKTFSRERLERAALEALRKGELLVIHETGKISQWRKAYSK